MTFASSTYDSTSGRGLLKGEGNAETVKDNSMLQNGISERSREGCPGH